MTSSVEKKQYEWKHEAEMTFISKASAAENRHRNAQTKRLSRSKVLL